MTRNRTTALGWLCVLSIALLYGWLYLTDRGRLYSQMPVYRSQAAAFLQGRVSLPLDFSCADAEMILYKGRLYYYYGPLPAFVQAAFAFVCRRITGRTLFVPESILAFLSVCGFAAAIYLAFSAKARALGRSLVTAGLIGWTAAVAVCGFSLFFSVARYRLLIFEESALYATALGGAAVLLVYLHLLRWYCGEPCSDGAALASSFCCAGAMLCRPNYATYPLLLAPWIVIPHLKQDNALYRLLSGGGRPPGAGWGQGRSIRRAVGFLAAPALALGFLLAYNYARFDEPTEFGTRYLLMQRPEDARVISFGSDVKRAPFPARLIDSIQGYITGYRNPLLFPHRGPVADRGIEETPFMRPPFTFQRVGWILFPLIGALLWHLCRLAIGAKARLARLDLVFLLLGIAIIGQHLWLSTYFRDIVYRYTLDMFPGFLALALAGLGFSGSYLVVTALIAAAFLIDAPNYMHIWLHNPRYYLILGPANYSDARCPGTAIPGSVSCGPQALLLHPRARVGWRIEDGCGISSTLVFVFFVERAAERWHLELLTDKHAAHTALQPTLFVQGHYFPMRASDDGQPALVCDFPLKVDAVTAKALPVTIEIHPTRPFEKHVGRLYSVRLSPAP